MLASLCPGIAAATIFSPSKNVVVSQTQLRVAFDGDAVLFSDESERIFKAQGLHGFFEHEKAHENKPLAKVCMYFLYINFFYIPLFQIQVRINSGVPQIPSPSLRPSSWFPSLDPHPLHCSPPLMRPPESL